MLTCQARSKNPIRSMIAKAMATPPPASSLHNRPLINLGLGDPTIFGLHPASPIAIEAMHEALDSGKGNGYTNGPGSAEARAAVAEYHERWDGVMYGVDDITLSHGAGQALEVIFASLVSPHSNVLLPRPGFHQYETLLANIGAECRFYNCVEENDWEIDLASLENLIDDNSAMILIVRVTMLTRRDILTWQINPSNPCGSNFSKAHLQDLVAVAEAHKLPIVADEIYGHMNWGSKPFTPLASISDNVPIVTVSGLSKRFLLPGWRLGWILLHDPLGVASAAKEAFHIWQNRFMGPGATLQLALPRILKEVGDEYFGAIVAKLEKNAKALNEAVNAIPGVRCRFPEASMYLLMGIDVAKFGFKDDVEFSAGTHEMSTSATAMLTILKPSSRKKPASSFQACALISRITCVS